VRPRTTKDERGRSSYEERVIFILFEQAEGP